MTEYTREGLLALAEALVANLQPPPPPPAPPLPSLNTRTAKASFHDVVVPAGATVARVPITLSEPTKQTLLFKLLTQNGTAREGAHFQRIERYVTFEPGEQNKIVDIPLNGSIAGLNFRLNGIQVQGWDGSAIPAFTDSSATIYGEGSITAVATPRIEAVTVGLPPIPTGLSVVWEELFTSFNATDTGFLPNSGLPCWRSRMGFGRKWDNGTIAAAVDPVLHQGTAPWIWEDGRFKLQSEYKPGIVVDGLTYDYTMPMITTQRIPGANDISVGSYTEVRATLPMTVGAWPAIWLLTNKPGAWPLLEFDLMEGFFSGSANLAKIGTTVHWESETGSHKQYGIKIPHTGIDPALPHTWGMWWGPELLVFYVDDKPYFAVPNIWDHSEKAYLKLNIAVGGAGGTPTPASWPVKMPIEWARVWR